MIQIYSVRKSCTCKLYMYLHVHVFCCGRSFIKEGKACILYAFPDTYTMSNY